MPGFVTFEAEHADIGRGLAILPAPASDVVMLEPSAVEGCRLHDAPRTAPAAHPIAEFDQPIRLVTLATDTRSLLGALDETAHGFRMPDHAITPNHCANRLTASTSRATLRAKSPQRFVTGT